MKKKFKKLVGLMLVCALCVTALPMSAFADVSVVNGEMGKLFPGGEVTKTVKLPSKGTIKVTLKGEWEDDGTLQGRPGLPITAKGKYSIKILDSAGSKVGSKTVTLDGTTKSYTSDTLAKGTYKVVLTRGEDQAPGYYNMSVSYAGNNVKATAIKLNKSSATMTKDTTLQLKATLTPTNATTKVTWTTSNKSVATVSSTGKVSAKAMGTATITAKCGDMKKTCKIKVRKDNQEYWVGTEKSLSTYLKKDSSYKKAKWSTSNKEVVSVTKAGKIKTKKHGKAVVTAKVNDRVYKFTVYSYSKSKLKTKALKEVEKTGVPNKSKITYPKAGRINVPWVYESTGGNYIFKGAYKNGVFGQYIDGNFVEL